MEFEKQSEIMDMKEEMMNDAIDDAMGEEDDEEERFVLVKLQSSYAISKHTGVIFTTGSGIEKARQGVQCRGLGIKLPFFIRNATKIQLSYATVF